MRDSRIRNAKQAKKWAHSFSHFSTQRNKFEASRLILPYLHFEQNIMPIHAPLPTPQVANLSTEETGKPLPLATNMGNVSPPRGKKYNDADHSPSKLVVVPAKPSTDDSSAAYSEDFSQDASANKIVKTEHKLFEESDEFEEPLLKENPHRFVLFPIQDNEVRSKMTQTLLISVVFSLFFPYTI